MALLAHHPILRWVLLIAIVFVILSALALWSWGRFANQARGRPSSVMAAKSDQTILDRLIQPLLDRHDNQDSGALLLGEPELAFAARRLTADRAQRSLDAQYYIWSHDLTGHLLDDGVLAAADRGVRVRIMIDDIGTMGPDDEWLAMDAHPNIEIRLFNPARNRDRGVRRALEMGLRFVGYTRRMHNKAWVADNRVAIVGGRNIGDEYYGAATEASNYYDSDFLLLGCAVGQTSHIFDDFWNSSAVVPLRALHQRRPSWSRDELEQHRRQWRLAAEDTRWGQMLDRYRDLTTLLQHHGPTLHWSPDIKVTSDPPSKAAPWARRRDMANWLLYDLLTILFSAESKSWIISPYFVPGRGGTLILTGQAQRGMEVQVLTNSLAANDVPLVHAGYRKYRHPLLANGVNLFELKPGRDDPEREILGSSGASLHSKAFVVDDTRGFLGSFNLDPRSAHLNTEMGVIFNHRGLASDLTHFFQDGTQPNSAWQVHLTAEGRLRWRDQQQEWHREPQTGPALRLLSRGLGLLPVESQL